VGNKTVITTRVVVGAVAIAFMSSGSAAAPKAGLIKIEDANGSRLDSIFVGLNSTPSGIAALRASSSKIQAIPCNVIATEQNRNVLLPGENFFASFLTSLKGLVNPPAVNAQCGCGGHYFVAVNEVVCTGCQKFDNCAYAGPNYGTGNMCVTVGCQGGGSCTIRTCCGNP
jgi:hypothetical protein